jgi:hypothetical protein
MLVNARMDDWEEFIPLVEFHLNSTPWRGVDKTPFQIDLGYQPTLTFVSELLEKEGARHAAAEELMEIFSEVDGMIRETIAEMREVQNAKGSESRKPLSFRVGDDVYLNTAHMKAFQNKLLSRWLGPLKILEVLKFDTYKIQLPPRFKKMHPIVHVSKLKEVHVPEVPVRKPRQPDPIFEEEDHAPVMQSVVDHRTWRNKLQFRVRFEDLSAAHDQWLPASKISDPTLIKKYREANPSKVFAMWMPYVWW